jgi:hypothetical protein
MPLWLRLPTSANMAPCGSAHCRIRRSRQTRHVSLLPRSEPAWPAVAPTSPEVDGGAGKAQELLAISLCCGAIRLTRKLETDALVIGASLMDCLSMGAAEDVHILAPMRRCHATVRNSMRGMRVLARAGIWAISSKAVVAP